MHVVNKTVPFTASLALPDPLCTAAGAYRLEIISARRL